MLRLPVWAGLAIGVAAAVPAVWASTEDDGSVCVDEPQPLIPGLDAVLRPPPPPVPQPTEDERNDIVGYIRECKAQMGISNPNKVLPPMKCLDGKEVPITYLLPDEEGGFRERPLRAPRTGNPVFDKRLEEEDAKLYKDLGEGKVNCARPQWLGGECWNYAHVQQVIPDPSKPEVVAVLMCRQERFVSPLSKEERRKKYERERTPEAYRDLFYFNDVGFIMTNHKTGKTCFAFQKGNFFGGEITWPDDDRARTPQAIVSGLPGPPPPAGIPREELTQDTRSAWKPPSANGSCTGCHAGGPWMHSPWVDQAGVVPFDVRTHRDAAGVVHEVPYIPVEYGMYRNQGTSSLETGFVRGADGSLQSQRCTGCHRIGMKGSSCEPNLDRAVGAQNPFRSRYGSSFAGPGAATSPPEDPFFAWMPLPAGGWPADANFRRDSKEKYHKNFGPHVEALKCCCQNPNARGCSVQSLAHTTLPAKVRGSQEPACAVTVAPEIHSPTMLPLRTEPEQVPAGSRPMLPLRGAGGTSSYAGRVGRPVVLDGSLSRAADPKAKLKYQWDFGDGTAPAQSSPNAMASHTFARPGTYTVTLVVTDGFDTERVTTKVVVGP